MSRPEEPLRRQPLNSVSTKIISFVFLSTFLTALVVSWVSIQSTHTHLRRQLDQRFPALLRHAGQSLDQWLVRAGETLESAGRDPQTWLAREPALTAAARIGSDGRVLARVGADAADLAGISATLGERADSGVDTVADPGGRAWLVLWRPGTKGARRLAVVDPERLGEQLRFAAAESPATLFLADRDGRTLASSAASESSLGLQARAKDLTGSDLQAGVVVYGGAAEAHVLGSALPLPELGAHLVVEQPFASAFAPVLDVMTRVVVCDLCIILLFSFLAYRISNRIMKPIEDLSEGARRISEGQLEHEIPAPRSSDEIGLLARTFNDMMRTLRRNQLEIQQANERLTTQYDELLGANEILAQLSITDGLTKLHNHRYFQDHLTREIKRVTRSGEPLAMLLLDLDDFKQFNDRMGHAAGDEMLVRIALIMDDCIRESDLLARYGGEEFVVLAPDTELDGAVALAEKIRMAVAETPLIVDESLRPVRVTISVGVALFHGDRKAFFREADRALYRAKAQGKNCVVVAGAEEDAR